MTYCVAIATEEGLVFCSDSRTNAGPDILSTYSKMHIYELDSGRIIVLLSAGNLATTQAVITQIDADLETDEGASLKTCKKMTDIAKYVGKVSREQQEHANDSTGNSDINVSASFIVGGEIKGDDPCLYMIYSAGNYISATEETPYLQIGESKYGKPILDRILFTNTSLEDAARCALVSMDSTIRANATVGPPLEILVYEKHSFETDHYIKLTAEDSYLLKLNRAWNDAIKAAFKDLPTFDWEKRSAPTLHAIAKSAEPKVD
jgi:putative proteasome-type protease